MPIVDQFKEIMQIHRQQSQFHTDFFFFFYPIYFFFDFDAIAILTKNVTLPKHVMDHAVVFPILAQHR